MKVGACPLEFWKMINTSLQVVPAKYFLTVSATSVPSENIFSEAGLILTKKRNSLDPKNLDKLVFLAKNLKKIQKRY